MWKIKTQQNYSETSPNNLSMKDELENKTLIDTVQSFLWTKLMKKYFYLLYLHIEITAIIKFNAQLPNFD